MIDKKAAADCEAEACVMSMAEVSSTSLVGDCLAGAGGCLRDGGSGRNRERRLKKAVDVLCVKCLVLINVDHRMACPGLEL